MRLETRSHQKEFPPVKRKTLQAMMDNTQAHLAYLDPQFNFVHVNAAYAQGVGRAPEDLIGRNHFDLFPHSENQAIFEQVRDSGQPASFQAKPFQFPAQPEREITYWDWSLTPVEDGAGEVQGLVLSSLDVTERVQANREREHLLDTTCQQQALLEQLVEAAPVGIALVRGPQHRYELVNAHYQAIPGTRQEPLVGRTMAQVFPEVKARGVVDLVERVYGSGEMVQVEAYKTRATGGEEPTFWNANLVPLKDQAGDVSGVLILVYEVTAQVVARRKLEVQQAQMDAIFENAPEGIVVADAQGRIQQANPAAEKIYNRPLPLGEDLDSHRHLRLCDRHGIPYDPRDLPLTRSALDGETIHRLDMTVHWPDGQTRHLLVNSAPIYDSQGRPSGAMGIFQDISERVRIEEALRQAHDQLEQRVRERTAELLEANRALELEITEHRQSVAALHASQAMFEGLFEASPDGILLLDEAGRIARLNRRVESLFGYSRQELLGQPLELLLTGTTRQEYLEQLSHYLAAFDRRSAGIDLELSGRRQDGRQFPVELILGLLSLPGRDWVIGVVHDLSRRNRAERTARTHQARFRAIFDKAPIAITLADPEGHLLTVNPAFETLLGYSQAELLGRSFVEITHPDDVPANLQSLQALVSDQADPYPLEKRYRCKDGNTIWARLSTSLVRDEGGQIQYIIAMIQDVSRQKQAQAELSEVRRRLAQSREDAWLLLAQELHDGPIQDLYGINFQMQSLAQVCEDEAHLSQLAATREMLQGTIGRLRATCHRLRPPTLAPFGLQAAIRSHAESLQQTRPDLALQLELEEDGQRLPESTRLALFRVYQQALSNILQHAQAQGMRVHFRLEADRVVLEIEDDGIGFELPERWVDLARAGHLGLVGAVERVESIGGQLDIISVPGDGTLVRAIAPYAEEKA